MVVFITMKKSTIMRIAAVIVIAIFIFLIYKFSSTAPAALINDEYTGVIKDIIECRNQAMLDNDATTIKSLYDTKTKYGTWAFEHEEKKLKYLHRWSEKQGVKFIDIRSVVVPRYVKEKNWGFSANLIVSTEYLYVYNDDPDRINYFRIGTYHTIDVLNQDEDWLIKKEWYTDPFADSLSLDEIKSDEIKNYIITQGARDLSNIGERRQKALEYADQFCGAAANEEYGFTYNKKYKDFNPQGGDCANFASQILYEGGKFKKNRAWNYDRGQVTKAWVNAQGFKDYMINSGRASLIASGSYNKVYKAAYKMLPGDIVAYEKKGKITHVSVVTGADSKGYTLVNCHNTDRYHVPWDLGWSDKGIKFYLIRVHF
jgi:hypothetical protein